MTTPPAALIVFDDGLGDLGPLTDLRPSFAVRTGADTTLERIVRIFDIPFAGVRVPESLLGIAPEACRAPLVSEVEGDSALLINGRCPLPDPSWINLDTGQAIVESGSGAVIAARLCRKGVAEFLASMELPDGANAREAAPQLLISQPWDVVRHRDSAIAADLVGLRDRRPGGAGFEIIGEHPVGIDPTATIARSAVLDSTRGPIRLGAGAVIRHGAIVLGPVAICEGSTVLEHALIKPFTSIGPHCKIAGELDGVIVQSHTNKAHDGHIGDSWLGSWINLGAGTTNSNLLNTYGEVTAQARPEARRVRTGMTFLGSIMGDHVKTSIGTQLMTGAVVGTGSMLASTASAPTCVGRFEWITDAGRSTFRLEKFLETARVMMDRRGVDLTDAMLARLTGLHAMSGPK